MAVKRKSAPPASKRQSIRALEAKARRLSAELQTSLLETQLQWMDNYVDPREPLFDDADFWIPLGFEEQVPWSLDSQRRGEVLPVYITEPGLKLLRDVSRKVCYQNEFACNALSNRVNYIVGSGLTYRAEKALDACPDGLVDMAQDWIDDFIDRTEFGSLQKETVERCDRDGEAFLRFFPQMDGSTELRFVEPEHVKQPAGMPADREYSFGIETSPEDVESVRAYWVVRDPKVMTATERVPAEEVLHLKLNTDRTAKRGLPTFYPVRKNFDRADKLLRNMSLMAQIQATFALIKKYKGYSAAAIQAAAANDVDFTVTSGLTGRAKSFRQYQPGSIIDAPDGVDYDFPAGSVNAASFVQILQAELRAIAARLNMPEFMLTADASNANYSSTMIAESPAVKNFESLQHFFKRKFGSGKYRRNFQRHKLSALWRVLCNAVRAGKLPRAVLFLIEIQAEGPSLVVRDQLQEAQKRQIELTSSVLSVQDWCQKEGRDYDHVQRQIEEHNDRTGGPGTGLQLPPDDKGKPQPRLPNGASPTRAPKAEAAYTEGKDASGHDHRSDGKFGTGGGSGKVGKLPDAGEHARKLLSHADRVPEKKQGLLKRGMAFVGKQYREIEQELGRPVAIGVMAAAVALAPLPVPGSSLAPIALAKAYVKVKQFAKAKIKSEPLRAALDEADDADQAVAAVRNVITNAFRQCGEKPPRLSDGQIAKALQGAKA